MMDKNITSNEISEIRINNRLSLRKKKYNKLLINKRKLFSEINSLIEDTTNISNTSDNSLFNNNIFKIISNQEILDIFNKLKNQKLSIINDLTQIFQCLFSLDYNSNQNLLDCINFMEENKIYIFLIDILKQIYNSYDDKIVNNVNNIDQLINKILQILFKYSSNNENNIEFINYINNDDKINIIIQILSSLNNNKLNNTQLKIIINSKKRTDILLYIVVTLHNLCIESSNFLKNIQNNKIDEKILSIINNKKNNIKINDNNIIFFINYFSLNLYDEKIKVLDEDYIISIFEFFNEKGITSSNIIAQELSLCSLCNITSLFESDTFYKKIVYSRIFDNVLQYIKTSKNINSIIISLKIINNILTEKNIDIHVFIKSDLFLNLINLVINYEKKKKVLTPDLLHHIISIFLYLTKSSLFHSVINNNLKFIIIFVELIGKISNQVTHDILTFIKDIINESYKISQLIIFNNKELILKLMDLMKEESHDNKITIMASIILSKIIRYLHENLEEDNNNIFWFKEYEMKIKSIIETKLLNENEINENLKITFKIILDKIKEK